MNAIQTALDEFLQNSTPDQLRAELKKGNRPFFQTLDDPILLVAEPKFSFPATVSFFQGEFALGQFCEELDTPVFPSATRAVDEDLQLAA